MTEKEAREFIQRIMEWLDDCPISEDDIDKYILEKAKEAGLIEPEDEGEWIEYCDGWKMRFKDGE
jgi:hypothetical protein